MAASILGPRTPGSLLERLHQPGDAAAWDRFARLYTPFLVYWGRRTGLQEPDVADLVQEVFALLLRKLPGFDYQAGRSFRGWLRTVLVNKWLELQRRRELPAEDERALANVEAPSLPDPYDASGNLELLHEALELLRPEFEPASWEAFCRTALDGQPPRQVAADLKLSVNAVYIARCRVVRRLREELEGLAE